MSEALTAEENPASRPALSTTPDERPARFGTFLLMWIGQFVSLVGSNFSAFAFGVWVFEKTGSATQFSLIAFIASFPALVLAPLAGAMVDRHNRRDVMLLGDTTAAGISLTMAILLAIGPLAVWQVYVYAIMQATLSSFQWPAYIAATTLIVPKKHLGRVSGLMQFAPALAAVLGPFPAVWLLATIGPAGIVWVDFATFCFAAFTLLYVAIPQPVLSEAGRKAAGKLKHQMAFGWQYIRERPGLFGLLIYFAILNLMLSMGTVLVTPMLLSFSTREALSKAQSSAAAGLLLGSVVMTVTGGPKRRMRGVLLLGLAVGAAMVVVGLRPWPALISVGLFTGLFWIPIANGSSQAIWQSKVPPDIQGRVFAVRRMIAQFTIPVGRPLGGLLADYVFNPLLVAGGPLAGTVGQVIGVGPGRGIGLLYIMMALLPIVGSLWGLSQPRIRNVEDELPDAV